MKRPAIVLLGLAVMWNANLRAQDFSEYQKMEYSDGANVLLYRLLLPKDFDATKKYPLLLFLHGSGERGNDNAKQLTHGGAFFLKEDVRDNYPAIVVFPQCSDNSTWARIEVTGEFGNREFIFFEEGEPTAEMLLLEGLIAHLKETYRVDTKRMYLGGLSMGGFGTFELVRRNPRMFAAAFPICGGASPDIAGKLKKLDWWVFHGGADDVVPPKYSTQMVEALKAKRASVKYSLYPAVKHNSWDYAFAEPELLPWLFSKSK